MNIDQFFRKLKRLRGQFVLRPSGEIRHKERNTLNRTRCCPMAAVCKLVPWSNNTYDLGEALGLRESTAIAIASAADHRSVKGKLAKLRQRLLDAAGLEDGN